MLPHVSAAPPRPDVSGALPRSVLRSSRSTEFLSHVPVASPRPAVPEANRRAYHSGAIRPKDKGGMRSGARPISFVIQPEPAIFESEKVITKEAMRKRFKTVDRDGHLFGRPSHGEIAGVAGIAGVDLGGADAETAREEMETMLEKVEERMAAELATHGKTINRTFIFSILSGIAYIAGRDYLEVKIPAEVQQAKQEHALYEKERANSAWALEEYALGKVSRDMTQRVTRAKSAQISVMTKGLDGVSKLWNADSEDCVRTFQGFHKGTVCCAFSSNGAYILTGCSECTAKLWDAESSEHLLTFAGHRGRVRSVKFSRDERRILTASDDGTAKLWDVEAVECIMTFRGHKGVVFDASFSPDGQSVVTASLDGSAKLFNTQSGACIRTFEGHSPHGGWVHTAVFSHDGDKVVTCSSDHTAKVWCARSGDCLCTLKGHCHSVQSAIFSEDDALILTASADWSSRLWDADSGSCISTFLGHKGPVVSAEFSCSSAGSLRPAAVSRTPSLRSIR